MTLSTERNKRLVRSYVSALSSSDRLGPFKYVSRAFRLSGGILTGDLGLEDAIKWRQEFISAFPDFKIEIGPGIIVAEGDTVAIRVRWTGTHLGDFQGLPPTHRKVDVPICAFFRIRNGLIDRETHLTDSLSLMEQLKGQHDDISLQAAAEEAEVKPAAMVEPSHRFFVPPENLPGPWWESLGPDGR